MPNSLIPELHDILKLCKPFKFAGGRALSPHANPYRVEIEASTMKSDISDNETWQGVLRHHHAYSFKLLPNTPDLFLLDMADSLAAAISRGDNVTRLGTRRPFIKYGFDDSVYKLWVKTPEQRVRGQKLRPLELKEAIEFLYNNPTLKNFYNLKDHAIFKRAEDATIGANLTSLGVHCRLTGQFYRILKSAPYEVEITELGGRKKLTSLYKKKLQDWSLTISKIKLHFPQKPFRVRDMHIFDQLKNTLKNINEKFPDYVLFNSSDEIIMLRPPDEDINILQPFMKYGFWLEYIEKTHQLKDLHPDPKTSSGEATEGTVQTTPPLRINPPICDVCQKAPGTREWIKDYILSMKICPTCKEVILQNSWPPDRSLLCAADLPGIDKWFEETIHEDLCEDCFSLRISDDYPRLKKLAKWSDDVEGQKNDNETPMERNPEVVWIKLSLDYTKLNQALGILYAEYLTAIGAPDPVKNAEIRFSVLGEFYEDYHAFLKLFTYRLNERFGENMESPILEDFFVIKLDHLGGLISILEIYFDMLKEMFPRFLKLEDSPVKLVLSSSDAKFPFFEHWEIVQKSESDIHIILVGKGEVKMPIRILEEVIQKARISDNRLYSRALHNLAEIAAISHKLADILLKDKSDKNYQRYKEILPMGMDFPSLLTLAKIVEDRDEVQRL